MVSSYSQSGRWGRGGQLGSGAGRGLRDRTDTASLHPELWPWFCGIWIHVCKNIWTPGGGLLGAFIPNQKLKKKKKNLHTQNIWEGEGEVITSFFSRHVSWVMVKATAKTIRLLCWVLSALSEIKTSSSAENIFSLWITHTLSTTHFDSLPSVHVV